MIQREKHLITKIRPDMYFLSSAKSVYIYNFTCIYMYIFSRKQTIYDLTQITRFNLIQVQIFFCRFEQIKSKQSILYFHILGTRVFVRVLKKSFIEVGE